MKSDNNIVSRASGVLQQLNAREKLLLAVMVVVLVAIGIILGMSSFLDSIEEAEQSIAEYEQAIRVLSTQQADFAERMAAEEHIQAQLADNTVQLRTFIEARCLDNGVDRPSTYSDEQIVQSTDQSVEEVEIQATINQVDPDQLGGLLEDIATFEELIVLEAIDVQPSRGVSDRFRVDVKITTFRRIEDDT